jgi:hypothetical protein
MAKKKKAPRTAPRRRGVSTPKNATIRVSSRAAKTKAKKTASKTAKKAASRVQRAGRRPPLRTAAPARSARPSEIFAPVTGAERREIGHVILEVGKAGAARVKRMVYPAGFRWSVDMKPVVGTDLCMHAHVGFLVHGEIHIEYPDGCIVEHRAPQIIAIEPGHDGWVVGDEPVVMIEFDFEGDTVQRLGMPESHSHDVSAITKLSVPS